MTPDEPQTDEPQTDKAQTDEPRPDKPRADKPRADKPRANAPKTVSVVGPDDGEAILLGTTRMRVLEDGSSTEHRLGVTESVLAPHTPGPPQHRHARHDEGFYILSGTVRFTVGDTEHDASTGTFVMVPPGAPHTFANTTDQPAVLLSIFTPDLYLQYFRDLYGITADGGTLTPQANIRTMSRYATEPATAFATSYSYDDDSGVGGGPLQGGDRSP